MCSLLIICKLTIWMRFFNPHIVNRTALRQPSYVFRKTSFRQSTITEEQSSFYSISVLHLKRLTTTAYFVHWNHHLASDVMFGLVPNIRNQPHSNSSDQEINIWAACVGVWCATGICFGTHAIHHSHHNTGSTYQEVWSDFPFICRRYTALFSI